MILERLVILILAVALVGIAGFAWRLFLAQRVQALAERGIPNELVRLVGASRPALLYFTTEQCVQCRFQQAPILKQLAAETNIPIYTVDAVAREELARFYGIMTVPTTVFLDDRLRPVAINHGLAPLARLQQQLTTVGAG